METERKPVEFNNPIFRRLLCQNVGVKESDLKALIMPSVGDTITLGNVIYKISYVRENPFRFTAEPVGILTEKEVEEVNKLDQAQPENVVDEPSK